MDVRTVGLFALLVVICASPCLRGGENEKPRGDNDVNRFLLINEQLCSAMRSSSYGGTYKIERQAVLQAAGKPPNAVIAPQDIRGLSPVKLEQESTTTGRLQYSCQDSKYYLHLSPDPNPGEADKGSWFAIDSMFGSDGANEYIYRSDESFYRVNSSQLADKTVAVREPVGAYLPRDVTIALSDDGLRVFLGMNQKIFQTESGNFKKDNSLKKANRADGTATVILTQSIIAADYLTKLGPKSVVRSIEYQEIGGTYFPVSVEVKQYDAVSLNLHIKWADVPKAKGGGWLPSEIVATRYMPIKWQIHPNMIQIDCTTYQLDPNSFATGAEISIPDFKSSIPKTVGPQAGMFERVPLGGGDLPVDLKFKLPGQKIANNSLLVSGMVLCSAGMIGVATYVRLKKR